MTCPEPSEYIICTRRKGQQKKHVAVCDSCRWQQSCEAYQEYRQNNNNLIKEVLLDRQETPVIEKNLLNGIQQELKEIILILGNYPHDPKSVVFPEIKDTPEGSDMLKFIRNELDRLRSLF